jgi:hypothetical protein
MCSPAHATFSDRRLSFLERLPTSQTLYGTTEPREINGVCANERRMFLPPQLRLKTHEQDKVAAGFLSKLPQEAHKRLYPDEPTRRLG